MVKLGPGPRSVRLPVQACKLLPTPSPWRPKQTPLWEAGPDHWGFDSPPPHCEFGTLWNPSICQPRLVGGLLKGMRAAVALESSPKSVLPPRQVLATYARAFCHPWASLGHCVPHVTSQSPVITEPFHVAPVAFTAAPVLSAPKAPRARALPASSPHLSSSPTCALWPHRPYTHHPSIPPVQRCSLWPLSLRLPSFQSLLWPHCTHLCLALCWSSVFFPCRQKLSCLSLLLPPQNRVLCLANHRHVINIYRMNK